MDSVSRPTTPEQFAQRSVTILALREAGASYREIARRLHIPPGTVAAIVRGRTRPGPHASTAMVPMQSQAVDPMPGQLALF